MAKSAKNPRRDTPDRLHTARDVVAALKNLGSASARAAMGTRFGIRGPTAESAFGVPMAAIQRTVRRARSKDPARDHALALDLWNWQGPGRYEAQLAATMIDDPAMVTRSQMDAWVRTFDNWATCDTACFKLFDKVPDPAVVFAKVERWSRKTDEFQRRASMALLASFALHDRSVGDDKFLRCLPIILRVAADERNFVKKGVSWAMRGIAQRSPALRAKIVGLATDFTASEAAATRWIGRDVLSAVGGGARRSAPSRAARS